MLQRVCAHFYDFIRAYPEKYEKKYGFLKPVVKDVVNKCLNCIAKPVDRFHSSIWGWNLL